MVGYEDQISGDERMSTVVYVSQSHAIRVEAVKGRKQTPPAGKKTNSTAVGRLYQRWHWVTISRRQVRLC